MVGTKILVVDDDAGICDILKTHFEAEGCEVTTASNGVEGLTAFKTLEPDLVLLDIMMPVKDGFAVAKEIRKVDKKIPIIFLTA